MKKKKDKYYTCKYIEPCDCGKSTLCEHPKSEEGLCDLDDKTIKCPLGLKRT